MADRLPQSTAEERRKGLSEACRGDVVTAAVIRGAAIPLQRLIDPAVHADGKGNKVTRFSALFSLALAPSFG